MHVLTGAADMQHGCIHADFLNKVRLILDDLRGPRTVFFIAVGDDGRDTLGNALPHCLLKQAFFGINDAARFIDFRKPEKFISRLICLSKNGKQRGCSSKNPFFHPKLLFLEIYSLRRKREAVSAFDRHD